jgi:flagella basal body P-ring formation protein FlgA
MTSAGRYITMIACVAGLWACINGYSHADTIGVPMVTIYPGEVISESQIKERPAGPDDMPSALVRADMIGKTARRTLLPDRPVMSSFVETAQLVRTGAQVRLVYEDGDLTILSSGMALQNGIMGDMVRVRNLQSGQIISGAVMGNGTVRVGGGL